MENQMRNITIRVHEPFAQFLAADNEEINFDLSLLDAVRFAGHACPAMVGAFMTSQKVVAELFPDTQVCERGDVQVEMRQNVTDGAAGPISNMFAFVFGAFEKSGFGGLGGEKFVRRDLLKFNVADVPEGAFRFRRLSTGKSINVFYRPGQANVDIDPSWPFQQQWRERIKRVYTHPDEVIQVQSC